MASLTDKLPEGQPRPAACKPDWSISAEDPAEPARQLTRSERFFGWLGSKFEPIAMFLPFNAWRRAMRWYDYNGYYVFKPGDVVSVRREGAFLGFEHALGWKILGYGRGEYTAGDTYMVDTDHGVEHHFKANIDRFFRKVRSA